MLIIVKPIINLANETKYERKMAEHLFGTGRKVK
jgi:hypothetical protein